MEKRKKYYIYEPIYKHLYEYSEHDQKCDPDFSFEEVKRFNLN